MQCFGKFAKKLWFHVSSLNHLQAGKLQGNIGNCIDTKCDTVYRNMQSALLTGVMCSKGLGKSIPKPVSWGRVTCGIVMTQISSGQVLSDVSLKKGLMFSITFTF